MRVIDFRVRPPARGFADTIMFQQIERTARMSKDVGIDVGASFRNRSASMLIEEMDRAGIERAVMPGRVNSTIGSVPNDDLDAIANDYPGRFVPLVAIDPRDRKAALP